MNFGIEKLCEKIQPVTEVPSEKTSPEPENSENIQMYGKVKVSDIELIG